jgi:hypothetical protein
MKIIEIKSKKQDNGIWGMPMNCYSIDRLVLNTENELLYSAIIIAIDEKENKKFKLTYYDVNSFLMSIDDYNSTKMFFIKLDKYEVIDNTLYEFDNEQEHLMFLRQQKLKRLENIF